MPSGAFHLYFHAPCFDGIVSAVVMQDFLAARGGAETVLLHGVNYGADPPWVETPLETPAAVVDFLYHPAAEIWFDHHSTTFEPASLADDYRRRPGTLRVYDPQATSCAALLRRSLAASMPFSPIRLAQIDAADRIDSARYDSPEEAVYSDAPAMRINASLAAGEGVEYCKMLVATLRDRSLDEVAALPEVTRRYEQVAALQAQGLERFRQGARLERDGIAIFDVDESNVIVSRYAPFLVFPKARYSLGLMRRGDRWKITAMRNPWMDFPSVPLGEIFRRFKGGGHTRVASTRSQEGLGDGPEVLDDLEQAIREAIRTQPDGVLR